MGATRLVVLLLGDGPTRRGYIAVPLAKQQHEGVSAAHAVKTGGPCGCRSGRKVLGADHFAAGAADAFGGCVSQCGIPFHDRAKEYSWPSDRSVVHASHP